MDMETPATGICKSQIEPPRINSLRYINTSQNIPTGNHPTYSGLHRHIKRNRMDEKVVFQPTK